MTYEHTNFSESNSDKVLDSGDRTNFSTGAVRDLHVGKGRFDLMPLDILAYFCSGDVNSDKVDQSFVIILQNIFNFKCTGNIGFIHATIHEFCNKLNISYYDMLLELAVHFESGADKYGEHNWEKGIPIHSFLDSGIRHLCKYYSGKTDERHDRAFIWNMTCMIWMLIHRPELNDCITILPVESESKFEDKPQSGSTPDENTIDEAES